MAIFGSVVAGGSTSASTSRCIAADAAAAAAFASFSFASVRSHMDWDLYEKVHHVSLVDHRSSHWSRQKASI